MKVKQPKICKTCGKEFMYNKNKSQKYCSHKCYSISLIKENFCMDCGVNIKLYRKRCKICHSKFFKKHNAKISKKRWLNHKYCYHTNGYIMIKVVNHPHANKRGYIYEHKLVMEENLGRYLAPTEVVHHKDGNKQNNVISNLRLYKTTNEHTTYHLLKGDIK